MGNLLSSEDKEEEEEEEEVKYYAPEQKEVDFLNKLMKENNIPYFIVERLSIDSLNPIYQGYMTPIKQTPDGKTPKYIFKPYSYHTKEEKERVNKLLDIFDLFPYEDRIIRAIDSFDLIIGGLNIKFLVFKFYENLDLFEYFRVSDEDYYLPETEVCYIAFQTLKILLLLKRESVLHKDVKLENFIVMQKIPLKIGIIDFDFAEKISSYSRKFCGTDIFLAPEILKRKEHDFAADIWSLGINLFLLIFKYLPFNIDPEYSEKNVRYCLDNYTLVRPDFPEISDDAWNLISRMLEKNPTKRITAEKALEMPWMANMTFPAEEDKHKAGSIYLSSLKMVEDDDDNVKKSFIDYTRYKHNKSNNKDKDNDENNNKNNKHNNNKNNNDNNNNDDNNNDNNNDDNNNDNNNNDN